jgi:FkbM family methyltransferase
MLDEHGMTARVTTIRAALGSVNGTTTIQTTRGSQFRQTGQGGEPAPVITLDELVDRFGSIDLLKLDIEGGEWDAIQAASTGALARIGRISMEFHPGYDVEALLDKLRASGFTLKQRANHPEGYGLLHLKR